jgi:hypothetical protein
VFVSDCENDGCPCHDGEVEIPVGVLARIDQTLVAYRDDL